MSLAYLGFSIDQQHHKKYIISHLAGTFVYIILILSGGAFTCQSLSRCDFLYDMPTVISITVIAEGYVIYLSQLIFALIAVKTRFNLLNKCFIHYFPIAPTDNARFRYMLISMRMGILNNVAILHDLLNDAVELLNICFAVPTMSAVGLFFVYNLFIIYDVLLISSGVSDRHFAVAVLELMWASLVSGLMYAIIVYGSWTTREGNMIKKLIRKAMLYARDEGEEEVVLKLNIFTQQLHHRTPIITCGLFAYNWNLLFTIIGATATYLVILIQFDITIYKNRIVNGTVTHF